MAEWVDWGSVDRLDKLGLRRFLISEKLCLVTVGLAFVMAAVGTNLHWIPEVAAFFLLGSISYKIGFRLAYSIIFSIYIFSFLAYAIVMNGQPYAIPLVVVFLLANLAGYLRARPSKKREEG